MSRDQFIQFVGLRKAYVSLPTKAFEFYPKAQWGGLLGRVNIWLQRKAWAFLSAQRALAPYFHNDVQYHRYLLEPSKFAQSLMKQRREIHDHWLQTARTLLIGAEDYAELMCSPEFVQHANAAFNFTVEAYRSNADKRGEWREPTVFGLEVQVVPWMRGMVVMP